MFDPNIIRIVFVVVVVGQGRGVAGNAVLHFLVRATHNGVVGVVPLAFYATGARKVPVIEGVETTRHEENEGLYSWRAFGSASSRAQFEGNFLNSST